MIAVSFGSRRPAELQMPLRPTHDSRRALLDRRWQRLGLAGILLLSLALNAVPLWWGLPTEHQRTWAFDEIPPRDTGLTLESRHRGRYPPLHYHLLRGVYWPVRQLAAAGLLDLGNLSLRTVLQVLGRLLSVVLATATVYLVYRIGRLHFRPTVALLAALGAALAAPLVFYAKTINLEAAYVFWFTLSLFFFARILERRRLRDYLAFGAAAACAVGTKDQAFALYLLAPVVLVFDLQRSRFEQRPSPVTLAKTLVDRRLIGGAVIAISLFALIHNLLFDWGGFVEHVRIITGRASQPSRMFEPSVSGHTEMLGQAVRHMAFALGWPVLTCGLLGVVLAIRDRNRKLLSLLVFPVSYYLFFIVPILYHRVRFFLPVCVILSLFAARLFAELLDLKGGWRRVGQTMVASVFLFTALRPLSLDQEMLFDSRYEVESWLRANAAGTRVAMIGTHRPRLPRLRGFRRLSTAADRGITYLRNLDADFLVVNEEEAVTAAQREFMHELLGGRLNYEVLFRRRFEPWPLSLDRSGLSTNLVTVNPPITVLKKRNPWGLSDQQVYEALVALRAGRQTYDWSTLADSIALAAPSAERRGLGSDTVTFGLSSDGWTRGTSPAAVVVENPGSSPLFPTLRLDCGAPPAERPVTVTLASEELVEQVAFEAPGRRRVVVPAVPPRSRRMYLIYADRDWKPKGSDRRRLGVRVRRGPDLGLEEPKLRDKQK